MLKKLLFLVMLFFFFPLYVMEEPALVSLNPDFSNWQEYYNNNKINLSPPAKQNTILIYSSYFQDNNNKQDIKKVAFLKIVKDLFPKNQNIQDINTSIEKWLSFKDVHEKEAFAIQLCTSTFYYYLMQDDKLEFVYNTWAPWYMKIKPVSTRGQFIEKYYRYFNIVTFENESFNQEFTEFFLKPHDFVSNILLTICNSDTILQKSFFKEYLSCFLRAYQPKKEKKIKNMVFAYCYFFNTVLRYIINNTEDIVLSNFVDKDISLDRALYVEHYLFIVNDNKQIKDQDFFDKRDILSILLDRQHYMASFLKKDFLKTIAILKEDDPIILNNICLKINDLCISNIAALFNDDDVDDLNIFLSAIDDKNEAKKIKIQNKIINTLNQKNKNKEYFYEKTTKKITFNNKIVIEKIDHFKDLIDQAAKDKSIIFSDDDSLKILNDSKTKEEDKNRMLAIFFERSSNGRNLYFIHDMATGSLCLRESPYAHFYMQILDIDTRSNFVNSYGKSYEFNDAYTSILFFILHFKNEFQYMQYNFWSFLAPQTQKEFITIFVEQLKNYQSMYFVFGYVNFLNYMFRTLLYYTDDSSEIIKQFDLPYPDNNKKIVKDPVDFRSFTYDEDGNVRKGIDKDRIAFIDALTQKKSSIFKQLKTSFASDEHILLELIKFLWIENQNNDNIIDQLFYINQFLAILYKEQEDEKIVLETAEKLGLHLKKGKQYFTVIFKEHKKDGLCWQIVQPKKDEGQKDSIEKCEDHEKTLAEKIKTIQNSSYKAEQSSHIAVKETAVQKDSKSKVEAKVPLGNVEQASSVNDQNKQVPYGNISPDDPDKNKSIIFDAISNFFKSVGTIIAWPFTLFFNLVRSVIGLQ